MDNVRRLVGGLVLTGDRLLQRDLVIDDDGLIGSVTMPGTGQAGADSLAVDGLRLMPGLVDIQINGGWGIDLQTEPERLWDLGRHLVEVGVTSFCPTLTSNGMSSAGPALAALGDRPPDYRGAEPIGWHFEGPWLNPARRGAHRHDALAPCPSGDATGPGRADGLALVTLAPELPGAVALIRTLAERGVVVSLGHSEADPEQVRAGLTAGATLGTHLFNAMTGLHHRDVGLAQVLLDEAPFVGLIADGEHVAPSMVRLAWRLAADRLVLVSDAVSRLGLTAAPVARLADGTLAGGTTSLDRCVANVVAFADARPAEAWAAASTAPARALGIGDRGRLVEGCRADIVAIDADNRVVLVITAGQVIVDRR